VPIGPEGAHYVPFVLPLWGVVEGDHLHVDNHINFVLHADAGKIIAAAAYPVRDRFQFTKPGVVVSLHGPVRWFDKGSFSALSGAAGGDAPGGAAVGAPGGHGESCSPIMAMMLVGASAVLVRARARAACAPACLHAPRRRRCSAALCMPTR
jgi:hypothetical protein